MEASKLQLPDSGIRPEELRAGRTSTGRVTFTVGIMGGEIPPGADLTNVQ